jgi:hypothetical protein
VDYLIDVLLIAVIFRQVRFRRLTPRSMIVPVLLIAAAGASYLRPFTAGGNDIAVIVAFTCIGMSLGSWSGLATRVQRASDGSVVSRSGVVAVATWLIGMGFRFAFAVYASTNAGGAVVARFSAHHAITNVQTWTTALVLMALGEVLARIVILQIRRARIGGASTAGPREAGGVAPAACAPEIAA